MARVLVIDDDQSLCDLLFMAINGLGHQTVISYTLKDGLDLLVSEHFDVVMLDVQLPDGNGIEHIGKIRQLSSQPDVIIMTGAGDPDGAELSIRCGAWDYVQKPASSKAMTLPLLRVLEYRNAKKEKKTLKVLDRKDIIGDSHVLKICLDLVATAASSDANVLVTGETGTGKELLARAVHKNSFRHDQAFIVVDCSAIPGSLVESLLFGHKKGAYTGADSDKSGLVKQADNGTLFLDEIGELPMAVQKSFLRVLQEHSFRPVGSKKEVASDFRLIAATNRNLEEMVEKGEFRRDLFFRLNSIVINSPSLRERKEDINDLAMHYISGLCKKSNLMTKSMSPDFLSFIHSYEWPGNIRELLNALAGSLAAAGDEMLLYSNHLPLQIRAKIARDSVENTKLQSPQENNTVVTEEPITMSYLAPYKQFRTIAIEEAEKEYFSKLASISKGKAGIACDLSGLSKSRLYHFFRKYKILLSSYTS